jgi:hypothetical protein
MSLTLLFFEVEESKKAGLLGQPAWSSFSLSTFGHFAALRLRSRRALSSAGGEWNLTGASKRGKNACSVHPHRKTKRPLNDFRKPILENRFENENSGPKSVTPNSKCVTYVLNHECYPCPDCATAPFNAK